jgi:hypothetical protein
VLGGYVGNNIDIDGDGKNDLEFGNSDPFSIESSSNKAEYVKQVVSMLITNSTTNEGNLSYFLYVWDKYSPTETTPGKFKGLLLPTGNSTDFSPVNQDYEYNDERRVEKLASEFHTLRRNTIIDTIVKTLTDEFNEHNEYAKRLGITYTFNVPKISREEWNNSIDDISVVSFIQGLPMGNEVYYNNYSLGGARLVKAQMIYGDTLTNGRKVYHREYCSLIPRKADGEIDWDSPIIDHSGHGTGTIDATFLSEDDAIRAGYYPCIECGYDYIN